MTPRILLVNPPIYDFAAYDFWLKPYGLLSVAGYLRGKAEFALFDYLDRLHRSLAGRDDLQSDRWGKGRFCCEQIQSPPCLADIQRRFRRFGLPRPVFKEYLQRAGPFDYALVQATMTYWYPGVREVIRDIREACPKTRIILGGSYVTLCPGHAGTLGADVLVEGTNLEPLWDTLRLEPDLAQPGLWELYDRLEVGVLKLADGCPFNCTYCCVPRLYVGFEPRQPQRAGAELALLSKLGVPNIAFYDDALLYKSDEVLAPFLAGLADGRRPPRTNLHCPNALNARLVTAELAELMVRAGFKTFYLGLESVSPEWHRLTGAKVCRAEFAAAVEHLLAAGAEAQNITAYQMLGHPAGDIQKLEESMQFVNSLGIRGMLADFSPIPGTPDGDYCSRYTDMTEPLNHNKTAFPIRLLGFEQTNRLKDLQRRLNRNLPARG